MKPIYAPKGKAKEYGDYAVNIYTGCPHRCYYCFAPSVLRRDREQFHSCVAPRAGIVDATAKQLEREQITGKTIHLCFTCDPYPTGYDTTATREIIKLLKASGNHVQRAGSKLSSFFYHFLSVMLCSFYSFENRQRYNRGHKERR